MLSSLRDWDRYADQNQEAWGDLQRRKGHTNANADQAGHLDF